MPQTSIAVLKFGSSVLREATDCQRAVAEIRAHWRRRERVIAVVSALGDDTNLLLARANDVAVTHDEALLAELLACGEHQSAILLTLALRNAGMPVHRMDAASAGLLTCGSPMNARPNGLDTMAIRGLLRTGTVVIPGFVGIDEAGRTTLLGRGGSDMTALFVAQRIGADRCRLVKDVDGIYASDPATAATPPARYRRISWNDAEKIGGRLVQAKAVRFARRHGFSFEVATLGSSGGTLVCAGPNERYDAEAIVKDGVRTAAVG